MSILLTNFALIFGVVMALSLLGWFIIAPFAGSRPFISLAAPWAGLMMMCFFSLFFYVMLKLPLIQAAMLAAASCLALSAAMLCINGRPAVSRHGVAFWLLAVASLSLIESMMNTYMSYRLGGPALFYYDGTDHAGWAWTADWLRLFTIQQRPIDPMSANLDAYQWIPYYHFTIDPRFGTFAAVALMSIVSGLSGLFSYDLTCALGLVVGILAMIGVYCRTGFFSILLAIGLITCHWFDYGKTGYLGKLIDYPSVFTVIGLMFFAMRAPAAQRGFVLTAMFLIIVAVSHMYAGPLLGLFLGLLGSCFIAGHYLFQRGALDASGRQRLLLTSRDGLMYLSVAVLLAVVSSGIIARPLALGYPHYDLTWGYVLARATDLEHQGAHLSPFTDPQLVRLTWLMGGIWIVGFVAALWTRCLEALVLIAGSMLLLLALYIGDAQAITFQLIGTFYPLGLVGIIMVCERLWGQATPAGSRNSRVGSVALAALAVAAIGLHVPRFLGALDRFEGPNTPVKYQFTKAELDGLAQKIGSVPTMIDVEEAPQFGLALLVGLGPKVPLQWSEKAWLYFSGCKVGVDSCSHRPPDPNRAGYRIVSAQELVPPSRVVFRTRQFMLIEEAPGTKSTPPPRS
jgi:hypothetical protein